LLISLKIQCHVVKHTLLQTAFLAILPTGIDYILPICKQINKIIE